MWCITGPVGAMWAALWEFAPRVTLGCALPFALWALAVLVNARGIRYRKHGF
jgi:hypothetical protein